MGSRGTDLPSRRGRSKAERRDPQRLHPLPAPDVVAELVKNPEKLTLGGQRREITAFFTDIEGFTQLSEELPPQVLTKLLNECLGAMTQIIVEEGGIVDKYIGDAIVAMFGAPVPHANHAVRAARAAMRCQAVLDSLNEEWEERGMPTLNVRIGINTGQALVGNMGSELRFDYTMIGDAVNRAARLEGVNRHYGTSILAGESTFRACNGEILMRSWTASASRARSRAS